MSNVLSLINKKLLILGANPETIPLIEVAQSMGVFVIVTDHNPNAPAKKVADKSYNVNGMDISGLIALCKQEQVDGVLVGVADRLIIPYQELCESLNLPCYASKKQAEILTNKQKFNVLCNKHNIQVIPNYELGNNIESETLSDIKYPVFVKPTDGNSGKGMSICENKSELFEGIQKALKFSSSKTFLVERYMQCDDMFIYYTFKEGQIFVSAMADRYTTTEQGKVSRVCIGAVYPSKYVSLYNNTLHDKMCLMFKELGVENGVFMISAFVEDGTIHLYDPGFRLQGEAPNIMIHALSGFDQRAMLVQFALTGKMGDQDLSLLNDYRFHGKRAATLWLLSRAGKIKAITGIQNLSEDPLVIKVVQRLFEGDVVTEEMIGTEAQVVARIYVKGNTADELKQKVAAIQQELSVCDPSNKELLLTGLDLEVMI